MTDLRVLANCDLECYDDYFDCPGLAVYECDDGSVVVEKVDRA